MKKKKLIVGGRTKAKFQYHQIDQLLCPYHLFNVNTDSVELDLEEKNVLDRDMQIDADVHLKYGLQGDEKYVISRKITNIIKFIRHESGSIVAIPIQSKESIKNL